MTIKLLFCGEWPVLCKEGLVVIIGKKEWCFEPGALITTGKCKVIGEPLPVVTKGPWAMLEWPAGFPTKLKKIVVKKINKEIPWGCCGGCA